MQNEEAIIFINKTKTEKEMDRTEENPSLQIESNKILGVNEEKSNDIDESNFHEMSSFFFSNSSSRCTG